MTLRIALVLAGDYPPGSAAARRLQAFASGLRQAGVESLVIAAPTRGTGEDQTRSRGRDAAGVDYVLADEDVSRLSRWRRFASRPGILQRVVARELERYTADAVLVYGHWWHLNQAVHRWCRQQRIPLLADCTEWWTFRDEATIAAADTFLFRKLLFPRLTGVVAISRVWETHAQHCGLPVIRIPSVLLTVPAQSHLPAPPRLQPFVITYVGVLYRRDLPFTMMQGILQAVRAGVDVRLVVVGQQDVYRTSRKCRTFVEAAPELAGRVVFCGRLSDAELSRQLAESHALMLLRDEDWDSRACFPTRLPEFLATGRPVITSAAGDAVLYLHHRKDAWLLPPGHRPADLAEAIVTLAAAPELANRIGAAGHETARRDFTTEPHMARLGAFVRRLVAGTENPKGGA